MGASHLHLVPAPCLHALSDTLRLHTSSPRLVGYASSPHFVPTLCRKRRVGEDRLRNNPVVSQKRVKGWGARLSLVLAFRSLRMRFGARGLRGVLGSAWGGERFRRGRRAPAFRPSPFAQSSSVLTASCTARVRIVDAAFCAQVSRPRPCPLSPVPRPYRTTPPAVPAQAHGTADRRGDCGGGGSD